MFSSVLYNQSQEDFAQDRQWLAEEWERCRQESAEANDSDTLSCSEFGFIDDMTEVEDPIAVPTSGNIKDHTETDHSVIRIGDILAVDDCISELNGGQTNNFYINFPYEQKDYKSYGTNIQKDETNLESLDLIDKTKILQMSNCEFIGQSDQVYIKNCLRENQGDGSDVSYDNTRHVDVVDTGAIEDKHTGDYTASSDFSNQLTDDVNLKCGDEEPAKSDESLEYGCGEGKNRVDFVSIRNAVEECSGSKYESSSGHNENHTTSIKVIIIGKELNYNEEVKLLQKKPTDYVQVSYCAEEQIEQSSPTENNDSPDKNIKHQTTQTLDILFRDKEKSPEDMFICEYCQKVFANQYKLDSHHSRNHDSRKESEERHHERPTIQAKAGNDWPPNVQELARRIDGKKIFFCCYCSYSVGRCDSITKHMLRVHSDGRAVTQFQCEVCGKMFVDRAYLRNHNVSHLGEKRYSCEMCGKAFHRQPSLKRHLQTHTTDRQYSCTLCDYQSNRKHMMYKHVEHHKQGRAYVCHLCLQPLYTQLAYRSHMYEHRVPSNSCSFCKVGFSSKERMMSHMRKTHSAYEINVYKPKQEPLE